jgi:hypothetical protein
MQTRLMAFFVSQSALNPAFDPVFFDGWLVFALKHAAQANFGNEESDVNFFAEESLHNTTVDSTVGISLL